MEANAYLIGFLVWLAIVGFLVLVLVVVNLFAEFRRLRTLRFPRPVFLLARRVRGRLPARDTRRRATLVGRRAWVSWDIRWLTAGETLASVVGEADGDKLDLELQEPIHLYATSDAPEVTLRSVRFVPPGRQPARYDSSAVRGVLEPDLGHGEQATAVIVVYPPDAQLVMAGGLE